MGLRPEHFEGIFRRLDEAEAMIRLLVMDKLIDIVERHAKTEDAVKIRKIFDDLRLDKGGYLFDDLVQAINESAIAETKDMPTATKDTLHTIINYVIGKK